MLPPKELPGLLGWLGADGELSNDGGDRGWLENSDGANGNVFSWVTGM